LALELLKSAPPICCWLHFEPVEHSSFVVPRHRSIAAHVRGSGDFPQLAVVSMSRFGEPLCMLYRDTAVRVSMDEQHPRRENSSLMFGYGVSMGASILYRPSAPSPTSVSSALRDPYLPPPSSQRFFTHVVSFADTVAESFSAARAVAAVVWGYGAVAVADEHGCNARGAAVGVPDTVQ